MFIKTGDKVRVIAGKDKGKEGTVKRQSDEGRGREYRQCVTKIKDHCRHTGSTRDT